MKNKIENVYTGFVVTITFGPFTGTGSNLIELPASIFYSISNVCIVTKAISYRISAVTGVEDTYIAAVQFLVCPNELVKVQKLIGDPGVLTGPLSSYPALSPVALNIPGTTTVVFALQEALILSTRCPPNYYLRDSIKQLIIGQGFTINNLSLLGDNIIITALPRDISPLNNARLLIGAILPELGSSCCKYKEGKSRTCSSRN